MLACGVLIPKRLHDFFVLCTSAALLSSSCNWPDRVLDIPAAVNTAANSIEAIKDYQAALSAIVSVMGRELKLPAPQGRIYFYRDVGAYQAALATEVKTNIHWPKAESREIRRQRNQLEFELFKRTLDLAVHMGALTYGQKVFIAEWTMMQVPWGNRVIILAHELTHVIQSGLSAGRVEKMHRWLVEGFAEWVSFKVVDALGEKNFFHDQMQVCGHGIANLRELEAPESWLPSKGSLGRPQARYERSTCAVHYLTVQDGVPAIIEYFRLFKDRDAAAQNFAKAFGESSDTFEQKLHEHGESTVDFGGLN